MRIQIPLAITFVTALLIIVGFFVPHRPLGNVQQTVLVWVAIITGFAYLLGADSLLRLHIRKISKQREGWGYSLVLIMTFALILSLGIYSGIRYGTAFKLGSPFMFSYTHVIIPLQSTMFSLLAFFIASAAYRAFRARTIDAFLLLAAGTIVMIGRVPIGAMLWDKLPAAADWILDIPNMAARRGVLLGIALGGIATALRIMLGIERSYLK